MLVVETIARIRRDHFVKGVPIKKLARDLRVSKNTIRKVVRGDATAHSYERKIQPMPKLGPGVGELDRRLEDNEKKKRRERLSLLQIHEDLSALGYEGAGESVDLIVELNLLTARMNQRFRELQDVADALTREGAESMYAPSGWPVDSRRITSHRGFRKDPFSGKRRWHDGVDIDGAMGDPIYAVASGIVTWSGSRDTYGELVEISHAGGYVTRYAHNSLNLVAVGDYVQRGQEIARMGDSGRVTGSSLHFEVLRNGVTVNPVDFLRRTP